VDLVDLNTRKTSVEKAPKVGERRNSLSSNTSKPPVNVNKNPAIVPMKMENAQNAMVYCPETSLMKKITLKVRSFIQNKCKEIKI
jgi:hypothetical protein